MSTAASGELRAVQHERGYPVDKFMFDGSVARESLRLWALWTKRRAVAHGVGAGQKPPLSTGSVQEEVTVFICYFENRKYNRRPSGARATGHCEESHHGGVLQLTPVERIPGWQSERPLHLQTAADSARGSRASLRKAASLAEALERRSLRELNQTEPIGSGVSGPTKRASWRHLVWSFGRRRQRREGEAAAPAGAPRRSLRRW